VREAETTLLVDCGHGVAGRLQLATAVTDLTAVLISHLHPDHFFDLVPLKYVLRYVSPRSPLPVYLPPGATSTLAALGKAIGEPDLLSPELALREYDPDAGLSVAPIRVDFVGGRHFAPAYAMRFTSEHEPACSIAYTSDTAPCHSVTELARGCELMLAEATLLEGTPSEASSGHMTGLQAGEMAQEAGARRLVITHYAAGQALAVLREASRAFSGGVQLAVEGATYQV